MRMTSALVLLVLSARLLAGPAEPAFWEGAAVPGEGAEHGRLTALRLNVELAPVTLADLIEPGDMLLGPSRRFAAAHGGTLEAPGGLPAPVLKPYVIRELSALWEITLPPDSVRLLTESDLRLTVHQAEGPLARARIEPVIHESGRQADGTHRITGGAILMIPTEALEDAGRFHARLELIMEYLP